jgi:hypothetical protein
MKLYGWASSMSPSKQLTISGSYGRSHLKKFDTWNDHIFIPLKFHRHSSMVDFARNWSSRIDMRKRIAFLLSEGIDGLYRCILGWWENWETALLFLNGLDNGWITYQIRSGCFGLNPGFCNDWLFLGAIDFFYIIQYKQTFKKHTQHASRDH